MDRICRILSVRGGELGQPPPPPSIPQTQATFTLVCTCCTQLKSLKKWPTFGSHCHLVHTNFCGVSHFSFLHFSWLFDFNWNLCAQPNELQGVGGGKGDVEVDAVLERVASSPLWSRVRQKVLQIVENFEIYMPSESGRGTPTARHDLQAAFPLFMCVPL